MIDEYTKKAILKIISDKIKEKDPLTLIVDKIDVVALKEVYNEISRL